MKVTETAKAVITAEVYGLGGLSGSDPIPENSTPTKNPLWEAQQSFLSSWRGKVQEKVADYKTTKDSAALKAFLRQGAGKNHCSGWMSLLSVFQGLNALPANFREGSFILGGWHSDGATAGLTEPDKGLLEQIADYRAVLCCEDLRVAVVDATPATLADAQCNLAVHLSHHTHLFNGVKWSLDRQIAGLVQSNIHSVSDAVENTLLFMPNRIFIFAATPKNKLAGWLDFAPFINTYSRLNFGVSKFKNYYWSFYPAWLKTSGGL
jgi:hypothetical protein